MSKWYGSLQNRMEEGKQFVDEIKVGTGVTEYDWSDRRAFEVIEVRDQKHIRIREYDHRHVGDGVMDNNWELVSNPNNAEYELEKRGNIWYFTNTITAEDIGDIDAPENFDLKLRLCLAGFDLQKILEKGKQTKRRKANISIGVAEYYYDYEF